MLEVMVRGGSRRRGGQLTTPSLSHQISDAVYRMVSEQTKAQYDAAMAKCEQERPQMESTIRTDMDQIITSKEHLASKIRGTALRGDVWTSMHVAVSVTGSWCGITTVSPRCSWGAAWLLPAWPGTPGEMPAVTVARVHVLIGIVPGGGGQGGQ